jgi:hypothetical protein
MFSNQANIIANIREGINRGEYKLPFFGDFAGMKPEESNATWNLMLAEESTTRVMVKTMTDDGFDIHRDQILNYTFLEFQPSPHYRDTARGGGIMTDWNLQSSVGRTVRAGSAMFSPGTIALPHQQAARRPYRQRQYAKSIEAGLIPQSG